MTAIRVVDRLNPKASYDIGVTRLPGRKGKCLYYHRGVELKPLAYFKDDADADLVEKWMESILRGKSDD